MIPIASVPHCQLQLAVGLFLAPSDEGAVERLRETGGENDENLQKTYKI